MISVAIEEDDLENGVVVITRLCKDSERSWYESIARTATDESETLRTADRVTASRNHTKLVIANRRLEIGK